MATQGLVTFQINSDGKPIDDTIQVFEIEVYNNVSGVSQARIVLLINGELSKVVDSDQFGAHREIEIKIGYEMKNFLVFSGSISNRSLHIKSEQGAALELVCESFDGEQILPVEDISKATAITTLTYGVDILSCSIHSDENVSTQNMGGVSIQGSNIVKPGVIVDLRGLGEAFDGNQYVAGVNHHIANGNWISDVNIGMVEEPGASDQMQFEGE